MDIFGNNTKLHHIGIAIKSIKEAYPHLSVTYDPIQHVNLAFITLHGVLYELVEPIDETSPNYNILKRKNSFYHVCYEVDDIEKSVKQAIDYGFVNISRVEPAVVLDNRNITWIYHMDFGLVELLEKECEY